MRLKNIVISILLTYTSYSSGQEPTEEDFYKGEVSKMVNIPNSPEAEAFSKYGDIQVNMYAGVPQISVPIHTIPGIELDLPILLSYDASGIQVEQLATWVGLGWNLNVGGRISRVVNGLPDDYFIGTYDTYLNDTNTKNTILNYIASTPNITFPDPAAARAYIEFLYEINVNNIGAQPDYYTLNVLGINETIVFDMSDQNKPKVLNNPRIKVQQISSAAPFNTTGWIITGEDGTRYFFEESEDTQRDNLDADGNVPLGDASTEYASSWVLTKIISSNNKDQYLFGYTDYGYWPQLGLSSSASVTITELQENVFNYPVPPPTYSGAIDYKIKQKYITSISHNGKVMANFVLGNRYDIIQGGQNSRLSAVNFFDVNGNDLRAVAFDNDDYFNLDGGDKTLKNKLDIRLKLNGLTFTGKLGGNFQNYSFEYLNPDGLPSRLYKGQDYFGYNNGASNSTLYPSVINSGYTFQGANREPNSNASRIGMLTKITYPTGGYTTYEYESHEHYEAVSSNTTMGWGTSVNASSPNTPELYTDDNGQPCDDAYIDPKIVLLTFAVLVAGNYNLDYNFTGVSEAYIVDSSGVSMAYNDYCDFYNNPYDNVVFQSTSPSSQIVYLETGKHKALVLLDQNNQNNAYGSASLQLYMTTETTTWSNVQVGGNRIAKITDYSEANEKAMTKIYTYEKDGESTGIINYKPNLYSFRTEETENGAKTKLERNASYPKGNEPFVVYSSVIESKINGIGETLGTTTYDFYTGFKGARPNNTPPFESLYFPSLKVGNLEFKTETSDVQDDVSKQSIEYFETSPRPISVDGLVVYTKNEYFATTIFLKEWNINMSNYYVTLERLNNFDCAGSNTLCVVPDYFVNPQASGYHSFLDPKYSPYVSRISFANGVFGGVSMVKNETFLKDALGNPIIVNSIDSTFYETAYYRPETRRVTDSKGDVYETTYTYPTLGTDTGINALVTKNNLIEVVTSEIIKNPDDPLTTRDIEFRENSYQNISGTIVVPTLIKIKKGESTSEDRIEFSYHNNGNLKEAKQPNGPVTSYVWGYDNRYPIAKIENASYTEIASTLGITTGALENYDETNLTNIDGLRSSLSGTMVTTYTYQPLVGVTSITDPRGYTSTFVYDEFNRLIETRDSNGDLVTDYEYHYKNQQ